MQAFFSLPPGDIAGAREQQREVDRAALAAMFRRQAARFGMQEATEQSLERLAHPQSRVIVTGQQTGYLLGPLYTLSKAICAVQLARQLDREDRPVLPVFWLASQDGDSHEIDHALLLDAQEKLHALRLELPENVPAGKIRLESQFLKDTLKDLTALSTVPAHFEGVKTLLETAWDNAETVSDWFARLLQQLLGKEGLLLFDPLQQEAAKRFAPVLEAEVRNPLGSSPLINQAGKALSELGFTPQLGRGANATNLFLEEGGVRTLLRVENKKLATENRAYTPAELLKKYRADPTCLTPAAGLRPITQDFALPTLATVVGPGELGYIAQLKGVYDLHNVPMPLIWPRSSATLLEPPAARLLEKYQLTAARVQQDFEGELNRLALELSGKKLAFDNRMRALHNLSNNMRRDVSGIDPTLEGAVTRAEEKLTVIFETLHHQSARALVQQNDTLQAQFNRLKAQLLPDDTPQERALSPFSFFLKFGVEPVMQVLLTLPAEGNHELKI